MYRRWLWPTLALPGVVWLILLFIVPFYAVLGVAFGSVDPVLFQPVPIWNPLAWNVGWISEVLGRLAPGGIWFDVEIRTLVYVLVSLALCLLIGYPVAYYTARHAGRWKGVVLILIILPLWISYMMRMLAWVNLLQLNGWVNNFLTATHVLSQPRDWLGGSASTVILALVYGYIPYLILPLFASLDRIDRSHLEAARDLGASRWYAFRRVTLPLSKTGILGGAVLITLPMFGDYFTPNIVSGSPKTSLIGNQIDLYFHGGPQPTIGAALTIVLAAFLTILMLYYLRSIHRAQSEGEALGAHMTAVAEPRAKAAALDLDPRARLAPQPMGKAALPGRLHLGLHHLVDRAGADRGAVLLQCDPLAHRLGGLLDTLVLGGSSGLGLARPDPSAFSCSELQAGGSGRSHRCPDRGFARHRSRPLARSRRRHLQLHHAFSVGHARDRHGRVAPSRLQPHLHIRSHLERPPRSSAT